MNNLARSHSFAHPSSTLRLGDREVRRLSYDAMRLPGKNGWGSPRDPKGVRNVVRRAVDHSLAQIPFT